MLKEKGVSTSKASTGRQEVIRTRLQELLEIAMGKWAQSEDPSMLAMVAPMLQEMLAGASLQKLISLLTCLQEISKAVLDLDCSQDEYAANMEDPVTVLLNEFLK